MEEIEPTEEEIELAEIKQQFIDGAELLKMTETKGYTEVLKPGFERRRKKNIDELLKTRDYNDMVLIQQSINAIDNIFRFIDDQILLGKDAMKKMKERQIV